MATQRPSNCALKTAQLKLARTKVAEYASLTASERKEFLDDVVREVWLLENKEYNWTELGKPQNDGTTSYYWTENRVKYLMWAEGTKDIRKALDDAPVKNWTGKQVFIAECGEVIMNAIYRDHPEERDVHRGFFKHLRTYQSSCYDELLHEERIWFEERARAWTERGATPEVKAKNARINLPRWLKDMTHKGEREFGVYTAFIIIPEPGTGGEPRIVDYLKELRYSDERLSEWVDWTPVTERVKEYVDKSHTAMEAKAKLQAAGKWVAPKLTTKPRGSVPSEIELKVDLERQCVVLPTELYQERPDEVMWHEEALLKEIMTKGFTLASNSTKDVKVPWKAIGKNPKNFFPPEILPPFDVDWKFPGNMSVADRKAVLMFWLELGYFRVNQIKQGKKLVPARTATAAPAGLSLDSSSGLRAGVVNRYGSHGKDFLASAGVELYEAEEDKVNAHVMEDSLIDPPELERTESAEHSHLAPCTVPETSEARAQYCLTALQLVRECPDKETVIESVKSLVQLPTSSRDTTSEKQIARHARHLVPPASISWEATSLLLADADVLPVREWLSTAPYDHGGFLGWTQAWKFLLASVMFLVSETSRTVNVHELPDSSAWSLVRDELPGDTGAVDAYSGREALSDDFLAFRGMLQLLTAKAWPGTPPSCRYRHAGSRSGYLTRICQAPGMADLVHLVTLLPVENPDAEPVMPPRTWGSWEWGRCGMPNAVHSDVSAWKSLIERWVNEDAFLTSRGVRLSREEGLTLLLKIALAWADCEKLKSIEYDLLPVVLQQSVIDLSRARLDIIRGIKKQAVFLKEALADVDLPPRPTAPRKTFISLAPDLHQDLVVAITRLREKNETLTPTQARVQTAHVHEARFRRQIRANIDAATARRKAGHGPEPLARPTQAAEVNAGGPGAPDGPETASTARRAKRTKKSTVPIVPVLALQSSLPDRAPQVQLDELDPILDMGSPPPAAASTSKRRGPTASKKTKATAASKAPRAKKPSTKASAKAKSKPSKQAGAGGAAGRSKGPAPGRGGRRKQPETDEELDGSDGEDFTAEMDMLDDGDEEFTDEEGEDQMGAPQPPRPQPRPRPVVQPGSNAELSQLRKRKRDVADVDGQDSAQPAATAAPAHAGMAMLSGATGAPGNAGAVTTSTGSLIGLSPDDPPSAFEARPTKRANQSIVEVSLERMQLM